MRATGRRSGRRRWNGLGWNRDGGNSRVPEAFWLRDRRVAVRAILDRWYGEDHAYFKLVGEDSVRYILRRDVYRDEWELILMEVPGTPATEVGR